MFQSQWWKRFFLLRHAHHGHHALLHHGHRRDPHHDRHVLRGLLHEKVSHTSFHCFGMKHRNAPNRQQLKDLIEGSQTHNLNFPDKQDLHHDHRAHLHGLHHAHRHGHRRALLQNE